MLNIKPVLNQFYMKDQFFEVRILQFFEVSVLLAFSPKTHTVVNFRIKKHHVIYGCTFIFICDLLGP